MSLTPTQLGAEPKKLAVLGALAVVLIVVYFPAFGSHMPRWRLALLSG